MQRRFAIIPLYKIASKLIITNRYQTLRIEIKVLEKSLHKFRNIVASCCQEKVYNLTIFTLSILNLDSGPKTNRVKFVEVEFFNEFESKLNASYFSRFFHSQFLSKAFIQSPSSFFNDNLVFPQLARKIDPELKELSMSGE